ncbi:MAG: GIY-YIG nuclease family protein [Hyphomonadaceae bacterium]
MFFFGPHSWRGVSGRRYKFRCVLTKAGLPPQGVGGIYIFVRRRWGFFMEPLYVGKAHDLRSRLLGHEKWGRAFWYYGATERYVLGPIRDEIDRRRIEEDLIKGLKPRMNDMEIPLAKGMKPRRSAAADRAFGLSALLGRRTQRA